MPAEDSHMPHLASRRSLARWLGAGAVLAAVRPDLVFAEVAATSPPPAGAPSGGPVRLSANENPYGPPPAALAAIARAVAESNRYPDAREDALREALAAHHGVAPENVVLGCGSSQILHAVVAAFAPAGSRVVTADPTFEAVGRYAEARGLSVDRLPLTADRRHDLSRMSAALRGPGLVYVCNPNNPTASLTPDGELRAFLDALPADRVALVDEAYHHYAEGTPGYASVTAIAAARPNVLVARTFSKIYGMAGLRCGYAVGAAPTIEKLRAQLPWDASNALALAAAEAALGETAHVAEARRQNAAVRAWAIGEVEKSGARSIPSATNFFMADLGTDVLPLIQALRREGVEVGRRFSSLPTHLRVTVGTEAEMRRFVDAFHRVWQARAA
jgi:histidinol-phosphate aminotransferase